MRLHTPKEIWDFIAEQWEKEPSNEIALKVIFKQQRTVSISNRAFTCNGLCLSLRWLSDWYVIEKTAFQTEKHRIEIILRDRPYFFGRGCGTHRKERVAIARKLANNETVTYEETI